MRQLLSSFGKFSRYRSSGSFRPALVLWTSVTLGAFGSLANCASSPSGITDDETGGAGGDDSGDGSAGTYSYGGRRSTSTDPGDTACSYGSLCYTKGTGGKSGGPSYGYGGYGGDGGAGGESGDIIVRPDRPGYGGDGGTAGAGGSGDTTPSNGGTGGSTIGFAGSVPWYGTAGTGGTTSNALAPTSYAGVNGITGCCLDDKNLYSYDNDAGAIIHLVCSGSCGWKTGFYKCGAQGKDPSGQVPRACNASP